MLIETTINISKKNYITLKESAEILKITKNELIFRLIIRYFNRKLNNFAGSTRIKYQKNENGQGWKSIHVWFSPEFYDKCQDLRKFHKFSISFILSQAIELYLNELLNGQCDNYLHSYMFFGFTFNNCPIFITTWDYPGNEFTERIFNLYDNNT